MKRSLSVIVLFLAIQLTGCCWLPPLRMSYPRSFASAFTVDNKAIIAGGLTTSGEVTSVMDVYNFDTNEVKSTTLRIARMRFATSVIGDMVLVAGGCLDVFCSAVTSSIEIYDKELNYRQSEYLSEARGCLSSAVAGDRVFFFGGCTGLAKMSSVVDVYNIQTHSWASFNMPFARFDGAATALMDMVLYGGGITSFSDPVTANVEKSYPPFYQWTASNLTSARYALAAASAYNKAAYAGGSNLWTETSTVDVYDSHTDAWSVATLVEARSWIASSATSNQMFFAGGWKGESSKVDLVDIYDAVDQRWSSRRLAIGRYGIAAASTQDRVIFAGGQTNGTWDQFEYITDIVDVFMPVTVVSQPPPLIRRYYPNTNPLTLTVKATGQALVYKWFKDGQSLRNDSVSGPTITINQLTRQDNGTTYQVVITDECDDRAVTVPSKIELHPTPTIMVPKVYQGQVLNITVDGFGESYTWYLAGQKIENNLPYFVLTNVSTTLDGTLVAVNVSIEGDSVWVMTTLTVWAAPHIQESLPSYIRLIEKQSVRFSANATGHNVSYVWKVDGKVQAIPIGPANQYVYTAGLEPRRHKVCAHVSNPAGEDVSCSDVKVVPYNDVFNGPKYYARWGAYKWVLEDTSIVLSIEVNDPNCISNYWTFNEEKINGTETSDQQSTYRIALLSDYTNGNYRVVAVCYGISVVSNSINFVIVRWYAIAISAMILIGSIAGLIFYCIKRKEIQRLHEAAKQVDLEGLTMIEAENLPFEVKHLPLDIFIRNSTRVYGLVPVNTELTGRFQIRMKERPPATRDTEDEIYQTCSEKQPLLQVGSNHANEQIIEENLSEESSVINEAKLPHTNQRAMPAKGKGRQRLMIVAKESANYSIKFTPHLLILGGTPVTIDVSLKVYATVLNLNIPIKIVRIDHRDYLAPAPFIISSQPSVFVTDNFTTANIIASGGKAVVYKEKFNDIEVAVKVFDESCSTDKIAQEIGIHQYLASLKPQLFAKFLGTSCLTRDVSGEFRKFLITEYATGGNLATWITDMKKDIDCIDGNYKLLDRLNFALDTAKGLAFMHKHNFVHYDIKLENILIYELDRDRLQARITDFGGAHNNLLADTESESQKKHQRTESYYCEGENRDTFYDIRCFGLVLECLLYWKVDPKRANNNITPLDSQYLSIRKLARDCTISEERHMRPDMRSVVQRLQKIIEDLKSNIIRL